jgi:AcrB/AcrD/AcrF family
MAGLVPILWSTGAGSEVMQRIAVPMIGGMVSSTVLTLVVIPARLCAGQRVRAAGDHAFLDERISTRIGRSEPSRDGGLR